MPSMRPLNEITGKWKARAQQATGDYRDGVARTDKDWAELTIAAAGNYDAGVQAAIAGGHFAKGVARSGTANWKAKTIEKGPPRWAQGIAVSGEAYVRGMEPYAEVIKSISLTPRGPKGSAGNYRRSQEMGTALHDTKLRLAS